MSNDEAPCEAFNLLHILELPIVGHIKPNKEFFVRYINKIYNTNASVDSLIKPKFFPHKPYFHFSSQGLPCPQQADTS